MRLPHVIAAAVVLAVAPVVGDAIAYNVARPNEKEFLGYVDGEYRTQSRSSATSSGR